MNENPFDAFDQQDSGVATLPPTPEGNPFDQFDGPATVGTAATAVDPAAALAPESGAASAARAFKAKLLPAVGTALGGGLAGLVATPESVGIATIPAAIAGGAAGGALGEKGYEYLMGEEDAKRERAQIALNEQAHPWASTAGGAIPTLLSLVGGGGLVKTLGSKAAQGLEGAAAQEAIKKATSGLGTKIAEASLTGARMGASETAQRAVQGDDVGVADFADAMARDAVAFGPFGLLPHVEQLGKALGMAIPQAYLSTIAGAAYDSMVHGKPFDVKDVAGKGTAEVVPFALFNAIAHGVQAGHKRFVTTKAQNTAITAADSAEAAGMPQTAQVLRDLAARAAPAPPRPFPSETQSGVETGNEGATDADFAAANAKPPAEELPAEPAIKESPPDVERLSEVVPGAEPPTVEELPVVDETPSAPPEIPVDLAGQPTAPKPAEIAEPLAPVEQPQPPISPEVLRGTSEQRSPEQAAVTDPFAAPDASAKPPEEAALLRSTADQTASLPEIERQASPSAASTPGETVAQPDAAERAPTTNAFSQKDPLDESAKPEASSTDEPALGEPELARLRVALAPDLPAGFPIDSIREASPQLDPMGRRRDPEEIGIARRLARLFGRRVVILDADAPLNFGGVTSTALPDVVVLNARSKRPHFLVTGHELWHHLTIDQPGLAAELKTKLGKDIIRLDVAKRNYGAYKPEQITDEIMGDFLAESFSDKKFWEKLRQRDADLFTRTALAVTEWLRNALDKLRSHFRGSQHFRSLENAQAMIADALAQWAKHGATPQERSTIQNYFSGLNESRVEPEPDLERAREAATRPNAPDSTSEARPLKDELGGDAQDYTAFSHDDMQQRAASVVDAVGSVDQMTRLLASEDGIRSLGLSPDLREYVQAETLKRAVSAVEGAQNDVDRIRAAQSLRKIRALWDVTGTEAGQHLVARKLAGEQLREAAPAISVDTAIEKQQKETIDRAIPVEPVKDMIEKAATDAGPVATERVADSLSDEDFERRLQPVLEKLLPMRPVEIKGAVKALTDNGETWREQAMKEAESAVDQQFTRGTKDPAVKGAMRTLIDNMKSILRSKVPRTGVTAPLKSIAEGVARVFLDSNTERALFADSWKRAREALLTRVEAENAPHLAAELRYVLPESPALWFDPKAAGELFKRAIAQLQGAAVPRLEDVLIDPDHMGDGVVRMLTREAVDAGMESAATPEVQQQMLAAWRDWMDQARGTAMVREQVRLAERRENLLSGDSPELAKLLKALMAKITPGLNWRDIFTSLKGAQREWELEVFDRIRKHEALQDLSPEEQIHLTRELSKAWQRERRKVFNRELEKSLPKVPGLKAQAAEKVKASSARLLQLINLGALDSEAFRDAVAKEWGITNLNSEEARRVKDLAVRAQEAPEGLPRRKLEQQFVEGLQDLTKLSKLEILENWWTASVLSGWRTHADILLGVANGIEDVGLGSIVTAFRTGKPDVAFRAVGKVIANLPTAVQEALHHIVTGDRSMMRNYDAEVRAALQDGHKMMSNAGRELLKQGGLAKAPGAFMELVARMLTAWDHINSSSTYEGAKIMALARHPELYEQALRIGPRERDNARAQARTELTGGAAPKDRTERLQENARVKEILDKEIPTEVIAEASEIGRDAALQGEPTGLGHAVWELSRQIGRIPDKGVEAIEKSGADNAAARLVLAALRRASTISRILTGSKFVRTAGHALNRQISYVPGIGLLRFAEGRMQGAKADILLAKQLLGTAVGLSLLAAFRHRKDDKEGIEGSWKGLTSQQRSALYSEGKQPNTVWYRDDKGKIVSFNYNQWGIAGVLGTLGAMEDQRRYKGNDNDLSILVNGIVQGAMQFSEKAQLQGLQQIFGDSAYSTSGNVTDGLAKRLNRFAANTAGGLIPRITKDVDALAEPELHKASQWFEQWAAQVPMLRELSSGKRVDIFGKGVLIDRGPLSRVMQTGTSDGAYRILGQLNERDLWLPDPSAGVRVVRDPNGVRRAMTMEEQDRYQRGTGALYRDFVLQHGPELISMEHGAAKEYIERQTKAIRDQAAERATRL